MNIAIIENSIVVNTIVCESIELAQSITGLLAIEFTDENPTSIGWTYSDVANKFIPPQPYNSWILNEEINKWEAPIPYPIDDNFYNWDETTTSWVQIEELEIVEE